MYIVNRLFFRGLLSAHVLAELLREQGAGMGWYRGELLAMAKELGNRLLPAFNSSTGIPHARVNLRHGLKNLEHSKETCTACAGNRILWNFFHYKQLRFIYCYGLEVIAD
jgi:ER degradation enhancer, mannosidase alpha-like 3